MDKAKKMMDSMIESQSKLINNWVDTSKKIQRATVDGNTAEKGANLYSEWLENQMSIFKNISIDNTDSENTKTESSNQVDDFFKKWYNQQIDYSKKISDFNQNLINQFSNFGKPQTEVNAQFEAMNNAWTNMYTNWTNTLNNTYENLSSTLKGNMNKDVFSNLHNSNAMFMNLYQTFQPFMKVFNSNGFDAEQMKGMMTPEFYKNITEKMFEGFFPKNDFAKMFETFQTNLKNSLQNSTSFSKEMVDGYNTMMKNMPELFSNTDISKWMNTSKDLFENFNKPATQFMKMLAPGKEKEMLENMIETTEKINDYQVKQTQLQYLLYTTAQKAMETTMTNNYNKLTENKEITNFNQFFTEWVNANESAFVQLFATDEFSNLKAEVTALSLGIKKDYDKQFLMTMENTPFAFKTDMDEVYKSIYELKKMVKQLQKVLEINVEESLATEEKSSKTKKK